MIESLKGEGLRAKALRGSGITVASIAAQNMLRLISNLVLTRLLFPEAFGLLALVQTFMAGLRMLSDTGVVPSIVRSDQGDDPVFLNTAWTVQICRGVILWLLACALAWPVSISYNEPILAQMMPVAGITTLIAGFTTTKVATAKRHLALGRLTVINLATSVVGIMIMVTLAWLLESVWSLVIGGLFSALVTVFAQHLFMPGIHNRITWNREAFREIFHFGKFIFLSSALGFLMNQGDKLVLGKYLTMANFGVYSIGSMLAMLPFMLNRKINNMVVFPICKKRPIDASLKNRRNVFRARRMVLGTSVAVCVVLSFIGVPMIELLYDERYLLAGPVVTLMCFALLPQMVVTTYSVVFLAAGDSRSPFILIACGAILQVMLLLVSVQTLGIFGVILVPLAVHMLLLPLRVHLLRKHGGWDRLGDFLIVSTGLILTGSACLLHRDKIALLIG